MQALELIDTHCHIDADVFNDNCNDVIARARASGVIAMVVPGVHQPWWGRLLSLCGGDSSLFPALGMHPIYLDFHRPEHLTELQRHAEENRLVAIGEIGLDYYVDDADRQVQQELFEAQLAIARKARLPVILHVRKAHDQVLSTLRRLKFPYGGITHAFSGSRQQAEHYIKLGFKIGFSGTLTYDRARRIRSLAQELPLETIVLETDAPDIPLVNHRDTANSPEYLPEVLEALAALRPESTAELARQTTRNARTILQLQ